VSCFRLWAGTPVNQKMGISRTRWSGDGPGSPGEVALPNQHFWPNQAAWTCKTRLPGVPGR